jgi:hypothetical protein
MTIPILNAEQLRQLTDAAAGHRGGDPYWIVYGGQDPLTVMQASIAPPDAVFGVQTRDVDPNRPAVSDVVMICGESVTANLAQEYDAVFWSEAAVEKFVLPYYASKSMWEAAAVLDNISTLWYGKIPPDTNDPGANFRMDGIAAGELPFALAHTPDSDWGRVTGDPTASIGSDFHLAFKDGKGTRMVPLGSLLDSPGRAETADRAPRTPAATAAA